MIRRPLSDVRNAVFEPVFSAFFNAEKFEVLRNASKLTESLIACPQVPFIRLRF